MSDQEPNAPPTEPAVIRMVVKNSHSTPGDPTAVWLDVSEGSVLMQVHPSTCLPVRLEAVNVLAFRDALVLIAEKGPALTLDEAVALGNDIVDPLLQPL